MFKSEKIWLFLLISICLIICVVLVDTLMDPAVLIKTVYARITGTEEPVISEIYLPDMELEAVEEIADDIIDTVTDGAAPSLQDGWDWYRNEGYAFEVMFPKEIVRKSILNQSVLNAGVGVNPEAPVWQFQLQNPELYQGTNLINASFLVHVLEGADQESACLSFKPGSIYQTPKLIQDELIEVDLNGTPFVKDEVIEGVMGEFYHRIIYRSFAKGACYEITQLLHYQNPDTYIDGKIKGFDQDLVIGELDKVLDTFRLLEVEPTFPEQSYALPKLTSAVEAKAISEYVDGIDVSHWQGDIGWMKVAGADIKFAFVKGTEGVGWTDVMFHNNMAEGENAGVYLGVYHFARPDLGNTGEEEANWFLEASGDYLKSGYLRPVLDLEVGSSLGRAALTAWVLEWMETVKSRTGISPLIYTNLNYVNNYLTDAVTEYDLWIAYWSCEPEPTFSIPPTGRWSDWAFWQYYGPGGCGNNAGFVPGISTNIDLNIFNGVEAGLTEYDALSQLWVSLTSDAYYVPAPYFADITGNVNGDAAGLIDFAFWWDCTALEADLSTVEGMCGALPAPEAGSCEYNDLGMRCVQVENEKQLAEHTYDQIGAYTAKVIVSRGSEGPVEDRYKISTYNPIRKVLFDPSSPATGYVGQDFPLQAEVTVDTSIGGVLQVRVKNTADEEIAAESCLEVGFDTKTTETIDLPIQDKGTGQVDYEISTRYRVGGTCPIEDASDDDNLKAYQINWVDEQPVLTLLDAAAEPVLNGSVQDAGEVEPFTSLELGYTVQNPSTVNSFQITSVEFENVINVVNPQLSPGSPMDVGAGEEIPLILSFELPQSGAFSLDVLLNHDAANPTPYRFTVEGNGVYTSNPILMVELDPASPGSGLLGTAYDLGVMVDLDAPIPGALQVNLVDANGDDVQDPICAPVQEAGLAAHQFNLSWNETQAGIKDYDLWVRYRDQGTCPIEDLSVMDVSQGYQIDWLDDSALLEMLDISDQPLMTGEVDDLGDQEPYQGLSFGYTIQNASTNNDFQIASISFENPVNVTGLSHDLTLPETVIAGSAIPLTLSFEIEETGDFSFDVSLQHSASNPSPFVYSVSGSGVYTGSPITAIIPDPVSPGAILVGSDYTLTVAVEYDAPVEGVLLVNMVDGDESMIGEAFCQPVTEAGTGIAETSFTWAEAQAVLQSYTLYAGYFGRESCPPAGSALGELTMSYQVDWQEDPAYLELTETNGDPVPTGTVIDLGQHEYYQVVDLGYLLRNTSTTSALEITSVRVENKTNLKKIDTNPESGFSLPPEEAQSLDVSFEAENTGPFSFDLVIEHLGENPSPYRVAFQGSSVLTNNPIKFVVPTPASPGSSLIGENFPLKVEVGLDAPDQGALQVSVVDRSSNSVVDAACAALNDNLDQTRTFQLSWTNALPEDKEYTISTRYRMDGSCPISDTHEGDLSQIYQVNWREDIPELAVKDQEGMLLPHGASIALGTRDFYSTVEMTFALENDSTTSSMLVSGIRAENLVNLDSVSITPLAAIDLGPEEEQQISVEFVVSYLGDFSFDLVVDHDGANLNPYRVSITGSSEMLENPIYSLVTSPASPGSSLTLEPFALQVQAEIQPPAPGVIEVIISKAGSGSEVGSTCLTILPEHSLLNIDLSWTESLPGDQMYQIQIGYYLDGTCPVEGDPDAVVIENYLVSWGIHEPVLIVNRPEGVTIFDGAVDYVGEHDFFRFVEVTYVIENNQESAPLVIESIEAVNLDNIREVLIEPAGVIEIAPGESQIVKINFQVLMLEPISFDLVWKHNGSNPSPYTTGIEGTGKLNLGEGVPEQSWLYRFLDSLIRSGFFLKLPPLWIGE